jgi:hypothetical protein
MTTHTIFVTQARLILSDFRTWTKIVQVGRFLSKLLTWTVLTEEFMKNIPKKQTWTIIVQVTTVETGV